MRFHISKRILYATYHHIQAPYLFIIKVSPVSSKNIMTMHSLFDGFDKSMGFNLVSRVEFAVFRESLPIGYQGKSGQFAIASELWVK